MRGPRFRGLVGAGLAASVLIVGSAAAQSGGHVTTGARAADPIAFTDTGHARPRFRPGFVFVGFRAGTPRRVVRRLERAAGARSARSLAAGAVRGATAFDFVLTVPRSKVVIATRLLREQSRWVRFAEPDYMMRDSGTSKTPNDPYFNLQWGSLNTGQSVNGVTGTAGADDRVS